MIKNIWHWLGKNFIFFQKISLFKNCYIFCKSNKIKVLSEHGIIYCLAPSYANFGDIAIFVKATEFFKKYSNIPVKAVLYSQQCVNKKNISTLPIYDDDLIVIAGGGNMGTIYFAEEYPRQNIVKWFPNNTIISLPQSVWFENKHKSYILKRAKKVYSSHKKLTIFARDEKSYEFCKKNFCCDIKLCPDMVLTAVPNRITEYQKNKKVLLCFRSDKESNLSTIFTEKIKCYLKEKGFSYEFWDTSDPNDENVEIKEEKIQQILRYFNSFQFVLTDRYHGTIFSYISKTPCIGLDNFYGKVKNGFEWFKNCNYMFYAENLEQIISSIEKIEKLELFEINKELQSNFDTLKKMISGGQND